GRVSRPCFAGAGWAECGRGSSLVRKGAPMASYRGHLMLAAPLGAAYGSLALWRPEPDWGPAIVAAGLATLGGLVPDLDSGSGVPQRELFGVTAAVVPALMYQSLRDG